MYFFVCIYKWQNQDNTVDLKLVLADRAVEEALLVEEAVVAQ